MNQRMKTNMKHLLCCCVLPLSMALHAACPDAAAVKAYLNDFGKRQLSQGFPRDISLPDARCARQQLFKQLPLYLGQHMGYKLGFTSPAAQQQFGVDGPQWGYMFDRNMVDIIAILPANFGALPYLEADLIVEVKDAGLAEARTPLEALRHLESIVPFIELPDLMLDGEYTGKDILAVNMAFRGGVLGAELPLQASPDVVDALANMVVVMRDLKSGQELGRTSGSTLMGNPLNAAIYLAKALKKEGISLKKGDLLSLGSFFPARPTRSGQHIEVQYLGLPGDPAVRVEFN
ncbi:MAG: hydratase [Betaproteobacteria bacterium]|nr:hydratase [Betaproteobacteria bacterium]